MKWPPSQHITSGVLDALSQHRLWLKIDLGSNHHPATYQTPDPGQVISPLRASVCSSIKWACTMLLEQEAVTFLTPRIYPQWPLCSHSLPEARMTFTHLPHLVNSYSSFKTFTHLPHLVNSYSSFKTPNHLSYHPRQPFQTWVPTAPLFLRISLPPNCLLVSLPHGDSSLLCLGSCLCPQKPALCPLGY